MARQTAFVEPYCSAVRSSFLQERLTRSMASDLGTACLDAGRCRFRLWAPLAEKVQLHILSPQDVAVPMEPKPAGYHQVIVDDIGPGTRYKYRLNPDKELPDPVSRYQPEGVHGPSEVIDP